MPNRELESALRECVNAAELDANVPFTAAVQLGDARAFYDAPASDDPDRRIDQDTLLYAASLAKQVIGVCLALTVRDGLVSPDDALSRWFPDLPGWSERVSLRQILAHSGALPEETPLLEWMKDQGETARTTPGMLAALHSFAELCEAPGTSYNYSNMGYVCLARIVELASDESLMDFSTDRIFAPLEMTATRFWPGPDSIPLGAIPVDDEPIVGQPFSLGDGGLWTTTSDFMRWNDAMNRDVLGVAELIQLTGSLNDGSPLEYAWGIRRIEQNGYTGWSHGGSWPGIFAKSVYFPEIQASFVAFTFDTDIDPILRLTDQVQEMLTSRSPKESG